MPASEPSHKDSSPVSDISHHPVMDTLLKTASGLLVVLDEERTIRAVNPTFIEALGISDIEEVLGIRLGQSLKCVHSHGAPDGCGTTEHCVSCGANIAITAALDKNIPKERTCALVADRDGARSDICLNIKASPVNIDDKRWILVWAQDITDQQFWANLERVFFHDINNSLTALYGSLQLRQLQGPGDKDMATLHHSVERIMAEVAVQKTLYQNKESRYTPIRHIVTLEEIKDLVQPFIDGHHAAENKTIDQDWAAPAFQLKTDALLVSKVLGNMVINALEATPPGGTITIRTRIEPEQIRWAVHNPTAIPPAFQKRIFQRHFSQKAGNGRGLGTYSMKLFGETYLKGGVDFVSTPETGTTFFFSLPRSG